MLPVIVRDATADDWAQIWPFLSQIVKAGETFAYDQAMDEPEARAAWLVGPPGRTTVAVDSDEAVVGTANMYPNRNGPGGHVASGSFMVDPSRWGLGTGRALCEDMVAGLATGASAQFSSTRWWRRTRTRSSSTARLASRWSERFPRRFSTRWRATSGST